MTTNQIKSSKTLLWGVITAILYFGIFTYTEDILRYAHTTTSACMVGDGVDAIYYNKPSLDACKEKGGTLIRGNWLFVFIPIMIAFAVSYVHGAFTSNFWDSIGFKPATKKK